MPQQMLDCHGVSSRPMKLGRKGLPPLVQPFPLAPRQSRPLMQAGKLVPHTFVYFAVFPGKQEQTFGVEHLCLQLLDQIRGKRNEPRLLALGLTDSEAAAYKVNLIPCGLRNFHFPSASVEKKLKQQFFRFGRDGK